MYLPPQKQLMRSTKKSETIQTSTGDIFTFRKFAKAFI